MRQHGRELALQHTEAVALPHDVLIGPGEDQIAPGRVAGIGTHAELVEKNSVYREIVESGGNPDDWVAEWEEALRDFAGRREEFLLYRATDPHWA